MGNMMIRRLKSFNLYTLISSVLLLQGCFTSMVWMTATDDTFHYSGFSGNKTLGRTEIQVEFEKPAHWETHRPPKERITVSFTDEQAIQSPLLYHGPLGEKSSVLSRMDPRQAEAARRMFLDGTTDSASSASDLPNLFAPREYLFSSMLGTIRTDQSVILVPYAPSKDILRSSQSFIDFSTFNVPGARLLIVPESMPENFRERWSRRATFLFLPVAMAGDLVVAPFLAPYYIAVML